MFALVIVRARTPLPRQTRQSPRCYVSKNLPETLLTCPLLSFTLFLVESWDAYGNIDFIELEKKDRNV
jgi:hypothetical protein